MSVNQHAHNSHKLPDLDWQSECYIHLSCEENVRRHQIVLKSVQKTFKNVRKCLKRSNTRLNVVKMLKSQNARERRRRERKSGGFPVRNGGGAPPPFRQTPHEALNKTPTGAHAGFELGSLNSPKKLVSHPESDENGTKKVS